MSDSQRVIFSKKELKKNGNLSAYFVSYVIVYTLYQL